MLTYSLYCGHCEALKSHILSISSMSVLIVSSGRHVMCQRLSSVDLCPRRAASADPRTCRGDSRLSAMVSASVALGKVGLRAPDCSASSECWEDASSVAFSYGRRNGRPETTASLPYSSLDRSRAESRGHEAADGAAFADAAAVPGAGGAGVQARPAERVLALQISRATERAHASSPLHVSGEHPHQVRYLGPSFVASEGTVL